MNNLSTILDIQLNNIENSVNLTPIIRHFLDDHEAEVLTLQYIYKEFPKEGLEEKTVDMALLRKWLVEFHSDMLKDFTNENDVISFYHAIQIGMTRQMMQEFLDYTLTF
jgi:hypothetical protein